jgi:energy-coupling factor transport system ATP-binding protein
MIAIQGFSYRYRDGQRDALHEINVQVAPGEFLVLTGPSGCGKSTLALAIGGYLFQQYDGTARGTVRVGGLDVREQPVYETADVVGLVQQNPEAQFCTLTVRDEVAFGLENRRLPRDEIRAQMEWALRVAGAAHLADRTLADLSGGEKQRVAIAAVMAARPRVLILDEPTSNLDPTATAEILALIADLRESEQLAVIVIEHKLSDLAAHRPRWIALDRGRVVYDGDRLASVPAPEGVAAPRTRVWAGARTAQPAVQVAQLCIDYGGPPVLQDLSLTVHSGEFVALMGDNGSGKTTLLRCLMGLAQPRSGWVSILGQDTHETPVHQLAGQVGYVFQNPDHQLFCDSVWQEATLAADNLDRLGPETESQLGALLARCGLGDRHDDHPYRLSYGEKRRLNLVSVLGHDPPLILLDEPLIGQDAANVVFLMEWLCERVARGAAVVMVNHNPEVTRRYATRLVFLSQGQAVVDAPTEEAFERLAALEQEAYLPRQSRNRVFSRKPGFSERTS